MPGSGGILGRVLSASDVAALCRAFLPQRASSGADDQGAGSDGAVESDPRPGGPRGGFGEGPAGGGEGRGHAAGPGGVGHQFGDQGDAGVHELPAGALDAAADEQSLGALEPRDQAADAGGGDIPGWGIGAGAGSRTTAAYGWNEVGHAALLEHGSAAGHADRNRGEGGIGIKGSGVAVLDTSCVQ